MRDSETNDRRPQGKNKFVFLFYQIFKMVAAIQPINVKLRLSNFSRFNIVFNYILLILGAFL